MKPPLTPPEGENSDIAGELDKAVFLLFVYTILFVIIPQALPIEGADANRRSTPVGAEVLSNHFLTVHNIDALLHLLYAATGEVVNRG